MKHFKIQLCRIFGEKLPCLTHYVPKSSIIKTTCIQNTRNCFVWLFELIGSCIKRVYAHAKTIFYFLYGCFYNYIHYYVT